jgi:hypothetical protein
MKTTISRKEWGRERSHAPPGIAFGPSSNSIRESEKGKKDS